MMKYLVIYLFGIGFLLFGCDGSSSVVNEGVKECIHQNKDFVIIENWREEILHADSVLINGKIPIVTTKENLLKLLGEPSKIKSVSNSRKDLPYVNSRIGKAEEWEYGNTIFDSIDGKMIMSVVDFISTDVELVSPKITLKKGLSAGEVCTVFPESCKLIIPNYGNLWSGHIDLRASNGGGDRRRWFLIFNNEKLDKVYLIGF